MFRKIKLIHKKYTIIIILLFFIAKSLSMEEIPGSSSPKYLEEAAGYYFEMLNTCNKEDDPDTFEKNFAKYLEAIKEKTPEEQFQIFIFIIEGAVNAQNKHLTTNICKELIDCFNDNLKQDKETRQSALTQIEEKVLPLESILECSCFDDIRQKLLFHYFPKKKHRKKKKEDFYSLEDTLNQSMLLDETALSELLVGFLNNWPQSSGLLSDTIAAYSPTTQFNALSSCVETALGQHNKKQAIELYEMLEAVYTTYLAGTELSHLFKIELQNLARKYPDLPSNKLEKDDPIHSSLTKVMFDPKKYTITQIKSPRKPSQSCTKSKRRHGIAWQKPSTIFLPDLAYTFCLRSSLLFAAHKEGDINCYDIKSGKWKKTLQYPGQTPLLFSDDALSFGETEALISTPISEKISLLSSNQIPSPQCALYRTKKDGDMSYLLEGNENGTLILHDLTGKRGYLFEEKHAAPITALLALAQIAYSSSEDRTIKRWNIKEKICENVLEEMEDTIHKFVVLRGNIISLMGTQKLVLCNLSEKPATSLPLFQLSNKEKNNTLETITTFNDEYLIAGCKNGQLKIFTFGNGFANIRNIDRDVPIIAPVKTLTNVEDERLVIQYDDKTVMIFSKE